MVDRREALVALRQYVFQAVSLGLVEVGVGVALA